MIVREGRLSGLKHVEPKVFGDSRGYFFEAFHREQWDQLGLESEFCQDNQSLSGRGVVRGLHFQNPNAQGKLVRVVVGEIFDVAVDVRRSSPTFGQVETVVLSGDNQRQFWIPKGFAHGFQVLSEQAVVLYKTTDYYAPSNDHGIFWRDPSLSIPWPLLEGCLSEKDARLPLLNEIPLGHLFA
jgi:dTDP-4-dehydrorhamnose 3,5-epimerase